LEIESDEAAMMKIRVSNYSALPPMRPFARKIARRKSYTERVTETISQLDSPPEKTALRVVSVSLGSATRDSIAHAEILGRDFSIERRGTNGDLKKAADLISESDGDVDAIGLGGIDLYLVAGARRYKMRDAARLAAHAGSTPVVDGSGLKDTLERQTIQFLQHENIVDFRGKKVLLTCAVDRFGLAQELVKVGARCTFGDFLFILNAPIPIRNLRAIRRLGAFILPIACRLPFKMLYPTGEKQTEIKSNATVEKWFDENEIIAGDFLLIRRFLPESLQGKIIITNTVTKTDVELLRERGLKTLITTTPEFEGRSFGANVMESVFAALGARSSREYSALLEKLDWQPRVVHFDQQ
jgi:hypothetical protein